MELLEMGAYGAFVWSSYGLTLIVIVISTIQGRRRHRHITNLIRQGLRISEIDE